LALAALATVSRADSPSQNLRGKSDGKGKKLNQKPNLKDLKKDLKPNVKEAFKGKKAAAKDKPKGSKSGNGGPKPVPSGKKSSQGRDDKKPFPKKLDPEGFKGKKPEKGKPAKKPEKPPFGRKPAKKPEKGKPAKKPEKGKPAKKPPKHGHEEMKAMVEFVNDAEGAEDIDIFWVMPPKSPWPPLPAKTGDALKVHCKLGRRSGKEVSSVSELRSDLKVWGEFTITVRRDWARHGADHFLYLVHEGFFNGVCLFRAVPHFLTQFGVSHNASMQERFKVRKLPADYFRRELLPLRRGTLSYAGTGPKSRTTQLWISFADDVAGKQPWETPVGYIQPRDGLEVLDKINTEYGDLQNFNGSAPDPAMMEKEDGLSYLNKDWPNIDYFESCVEAGVAEEEKPEKPQREEKKIGTVMAGDQLSHRTNVGHIFIARTAGDNPKDVNRVAVRRAREVVNLSFGSREL